MTEDERRTEERRRRDRERQARRRARQRRQIQLEENLIPPEEVPEDFIPSATEVYEFREGNLHGHLPVRIRQLARHTKGVAREEVLKWMGPLILQGATCVQIAAIFNISVATAHRWKVAYRELLREQTLSVDPIDTYASAKDRLETMRRYVFQQITNLDQNQAAPALPDIDPNNPQAAQAMQQQITALVQQAGQSGSNRMRSKIALIGKFIELEKMELALNVQYGVVDVNTYRIARQAKADQGGTTIELLQVAKDLFADIKEVQEAQGDDLLALFEELGMGEGDAA